VIGMALVYLAPPVATIAGLAAGASAAASLGAVAWLAMAVAYRPTLALYGQPAVAGLLLPVAAVLYTLMTIDSARRWRRGEGGRWKGRRYAAEE